MRAPVASSPRCGGCGAGDLFPRLPQPSSLGRFTTAEALDHDDCGQPLPHVAVAAKQAPISLDYLHDRPSTPERDDGTELVAEIQSAIRHLRPDYRIVFVMFHEQGNSYEEIALAIEKPVGTVKTWLRRARLEVLDALRRRGVLPKDEPLDKPASSIS